MKDIQSRKDVEFLIGEFYKLVVTDDLIGFFFTKVIKLDWDKHIPVMIDFWETMLLEEEKYKGNPMLKHLQLNAKEPIKAEYFGKWLFLWERTINKHFSGAKATEAVQRAKQIGELMQFKIKQQTTTNKK